MRSPGEIIDTVMALDTLADLPRTGWLLCGVRPCESIAEHSLGVVIVSMFLVDAVRAAGEQVDGERTLRMAALHDAAEARTGDVPMPCKSPALDSALREVEQQAVRSLLPERYTRLWTEAEDRSSLEARIVAAADKLQMMIKLLGYERRGYRNLDRFWENPGNLRDMGLAPAEELFAAIVRRRQTQPA